jgi:hypothetical protein
MKQLILALLAYYLIFQGLSLILMLFLLDMSLLLKIIAGLAGSFFIWIGYFMRLERKAELAQNEAIYEAIRAFTDKGIETINSNELYYWLIDNSNWYTEEKAFNNDDILKTFNHFYKEDLLPMQTKLILEQLDFDGRDRSSSKFLYEIYPRMYKEGCEMTKVEGRNRVSQKLKSIGFSGGAGIGGFSPYYQEVFDKCKREGLIPKNITLTDGR